MQRLQILIVAVLFSSGLYAQTATEAYRISLSDPIGTARNLGTGNSMFAIGPDISVIGSNPAGIGSFWKSEFTITLGGQFNNYTSLLSADRNNITKGNYGIFTLPNIGIVLTSRPGGSMVASNWSFGFNRIAEYRRELNYGGSTIGSMTDSWIENSIGKLASDLNGFEEGLAFESGAIYDFEDDRIYESDYQLSPGYRLLKFEDSYLEGGKSELYLGYGANINNKLLFGFTFNMPLVNFTEYRDYSEVDGAEDGIPYFNNLNYTSYINSTGFGINGKFGLTYKPTQNLNLSFAAHTPSRIFLTDNYNTTVTYDFTVQEHDGPIYADSDFGSFRYAMATPWSLMGGLGIIAGKQGFIGASVKWTDYGSMRYDYSTYQNGFFYEEEERKVNQDIREQYGAAFDINLGGELVLGAMRLRGGTSLAQSPYSNDNNFDPSYHAGLGYRSDNYYVDFGYRWANQNDGFLPYETNDAPQPLVQIDNNKHTVIMTVGFKF